MLRSGAMVAERMRGWVAGVVIFTLAGVAAAAGRPPLPVRDDKAGKWGFADPRGATVVPAQFLRVTRFHEGLAAVCREPDRWEYIDVTGKTVIPGPFQEARSFFDGRAAVRAEAGGPLGYIDPTGKLVIPARFKLAEDFHDRRAVVRVDAKGQLGAIDARGELVAPARFAALGPYADGLAPFSDGKRWGYVDRDGRVVIPPRFVRAEPFSEELAFVVLKEVKTKLDAAYIDRSGEIVVKGLTQPGGPFHEGLARIYDLTTGHFIDRTGKKVIEGTGWVGDFSEGLAGVAEGGKVGYVDRGGKPVIAPQWDSAGAFADGVAVVADLKDNALVNHRYIDRTGKVLATVSATEAPP